jgi:hypothetical protein
MLCVTCLIRHEHIAMIRAVVPACAQHIFGAMRTRSVIAPLMCLVSVLACNSSTGPGYNITGSWRRSDDSTGAYFFQHGTVVKGFWIPHNTVQPDLICGSVSGRTVTLTIAGQPYQGMFTDNQMIQGSYTVDSAGVGTVQVPLNFTLLSSSPPPVAFAGTCPGF